MIHGSAGELPLDPCKDFDLISWYRTPNSVLCIGTGILLYNHGDVLRTDPLLLLRAGVSGSFVASHRRRVSDQRNKRRRNLLSCG